MRNFYLSKAIYTLAASAIGIFLPTYFFSHGISLSAICGWLAVSSLTHVALLRPAISLSAKRSALSCLATGVALNVVLYASVQAESVLSLFWGLALLHGAAMAFYWTGYHLYLSHRVDKHICGSQLAKLKNISRISSLATPVLSALLISSAGYATYFVAMAGVSFASLIPLFRETNRVHSRDCTLSEVVSNISEGPVSQSLPFAVAFSFGDSVHNDLWPIYLFTAGISVTSLGLAYAAAFLAMLVVNYVLGQLINLKPTTTLRAGAIGTMLVNILRATGGAAIPVGALTTGAEVANTAVNLSVDAMTYTNARNTDAVAYIMSRELLINSGRVLVFGLAAWLANIQTMAALAVLTTLCYWWLVPLKHKST